MEATRIQPVEQPPANVFPRDGLDVAGVDIRHAAINLGAPRCTSGSGCASRDSISSPVSVARLSFGELRRVTKQRCDVLGHVPFYPEGQCARPRLRFNFSSSGFDVPMAGAAPRLGSIEPSSGLGADVVPDVELVPGTSRAFCVPACDALRSVTATRLALLRRPCIIRLSRSAYPAPPLDFGALCSCAVCYLQTNGPRARQVRINSSR